MNMRIWSILALALILSACGTSVSLNEDKVTVEDRTGTAVGAERAAPTASQPPVAEPRAATQSRVEPVAIDSAASQAAGPVGVERLIYFDYDSYTIRPEFQALIEGHARFLRANPARRIAIEGHTDERGGREYNLALGQKRAEAVRRALALLGVADAQVEAVSFGKEKPASTGSDEGAWARNRRAEIAYR